MKKCCGEEMIKVYKEDGIEGYRCMKCDFVEWNGEPKTSYLKLDNDLIKLFKKE